MNAKRVIGIAGFVVLAGLVLTGLLVVSIAVPNVTAHLERARMAKAEAEISAMETALTAVLADSGCRTFQQLFDVAEFRRALDQEMKRSGADEISARVHIHSALASVVLRNGIDTADALAENPKTRDLSEIIPEDVLQRLGNKYIDDFPEADPWGSPYQFFFGPWPGNGGLIPFRIYVDQSDDAETDALTVSKTDPSGAAVQVGFPASSIKPFYIWSKGKNGQSDQAIFDPSGQYAAPASQHYPPGEMGGGDDINNWDRYASYKDFYQAQ